MNETGWLEEHENRVEECKDDWSNVCTSEFIERCEELIEEIKRLRNEVDYFRKKM